MEPSLEAVLSAKSAATEECGRINFSGAGRKPALSQEDQLLMALMTPRLARNEQDIAYQFGVNVSCVSRTLIMWFNFLYLGLGLLPIWPDWDNVEQSMPECFKPTYSTTLATKDTAELNCESSLSLSLQSQHYSSYKSHTTMSLWLWHEMFHLYSCDQKLFIESSVFE